VEEVKFHPAVYGHCGVVIFFFFPEHGGHRLSRSTSIVNHMFSTFGQPEHMTLLALSLGRHADRRRHVLENVFRHMEEGLPRREAAEFGTSEIGLAVMATTFSIAAVFIPVAFMQGIVGRFFYAFGMTVTAAVLISLFVSFTLTPMLSSRFLTIPEGHGFLYRLIERFLSFVDRRYRGLLGWSLRHRFSVVAIGILVFAGSLYLARFVGVEFLPQADESQFSVAIKTAPGASLQATDAVAREVEAIVRQHATVTDLLRPWRRHAGQGQRRVDPGQARDAQPAAIPAGGRERAAPGAGLFRAA
jgi:HAE1 family hydrophobic/amphiphilic exporter-1